MRKKIEEELAKLAFGDLDADAAQRLELQTKADPEASRTFDSYCRMKNELRSLCNDVPADQLSKDRLREAILTRGLKEHRPVSRLSWLWMPAAAAVLAFSFVALKGRIPTGGPSMGPMVVDNSNGKLPAIEGVGVERPPVNTATVAAKSEPAKIVVEKRPTVVAMNTDRGSRNRRDDYEPMVSRNQGTEGLRGSAIDSGIDFDSPGLVSEGDFSKEVSFGGPRRDEKMETAVREQPQVERAQPKIVLITSETDASTGTLKATEVESTANVLVGG